MLKNVALSLVCIGKSKFAFVSHISKTTSMKNTVNKIFHLVFIIIVIFLTGYRATAQYKEFKLSPKGDTLNVIDKNNLKQGKWVIVVAALRGEPGYEEEGYFKDDQKTGPWRRYNSTGDILAVENYRFGGKDGVQEYFTFLGDLVRHEEWRGFNPDAPYDTIPVYGDNNSEIVNYKIVKAEQYSVPHGEWKYYNPGERLIKMETYDRGHLLKSDDGNLLTAKPKQALPDENVKPQEVLDYEKKYSKKKRAHLERSGQTSPD
jgi:hypothetical protein